MKYNRPVIKVFPERRQRRARHSAGRILVPLISSPPRGARYCAVLFSKENETHTWSIEFLHSSRKSCDPRKCKFSLAPQLQEKLSNVRSLAERNTRAKSPWPLSAPSGLPARRLVREPKIALKYHEGRFFDTQHKDKPRNVSGDHTESCRHVHALRCCHGTVAPDVLLVLKPRRCKDAVLFAFVCGTTVPSVTKRKPLLIGSSGK